MSIILLMILFHLNTLLKSVILPLCFVLIAGWCQKLNFAIPNL